MTVASTSTNATRTQTPTVATSDRPRTWLRRIMGGGQIIETCPAWCTSDHLHDQGSALEDLTHVSRAVTAEVEVVDTWADGEAVRMTAPILVAQIRHNPYSENPQRNQPFATFEPSDGEIADELGPEELAAIVARIRAHADRLDDVITQLVQARAEYAGTTVVA